MEKLQNRHQIKWLAMMACMVYFSSYITRINFGVIIVEFITAEQVAKTYASLITSVAFITYGIGQLISGYLGDHLAPQKLIFMGLVTTAAANTLLPLCSPHIPVMAAVWGINGMAQAFMWPPLVKILKSALDDRDYGRIIPLISVSSAAATIAIYLFAPLFIHIAGWKMVFAVCAPVGIAAAFLWRFGYAKMFSGTSFQIASGSRAEKNSKAGDSLFSLLPVILLTICMQGMLRDGITTWTPNLMGETFHLESVVSILTGVALPIFQILVTMSVYRILCKMNGDVFACMTVFFGGVSFLLLILSLFGMARPSVSLILIAFANGGLHGINLLQTSYVPALFKNSSNISFLAGVLNAATYVGSALATWLFALMAERWGWHTTVWGWVVIACFGMILTFVCRRLYQRFR